MQSLQNTQKEIVYLDVEKIYPNPYQPRKVFEEQSIDELAQSIENYGVIEPIIVREKKCIYELVAGERRLSGICRK